jgi:hypothetical protein
MQVIIAKHLKLKQIIKLRQKNLNWLDIPNIITLLK